MVNSSSLGITTSQCEFYGSACWIKSRSPRAVVVLNAKVWGATSQPGFCLKSMCHVDSGVDVPIRSIGFYRYIVVYLKKSWVLLCFFCQLKTLFLCDAWKLCWNRLLSHGFPSDGICNRHWQDGCVPAGHGTVSAANAGPLIHKDHPFCTKVTTKPLPLTASG